MLVVLPDYSVSIEDPEITLVKSKRIQRWSDPLLSDKVSEDRLDFVAVMLIYNISI